MLLINFVRATLLMLWLALFLTFAPTSPYLTVLVGWLGLAVVLTLGDIADQKLRELFSR